MNEGGGWPIVDLGDLLTDVQTGFASGKHNSDGVGVPHLRPMNVSTDGQIDRAVLKSVDPTLADRPARRLLRGDVLFNNTNSPELVGKTAFFDADDHPSFSNHMTRLRVDETRLDPRFLALRLHQAWRDGWFADHCNNHVSQASIGRDVLRSFRFELPPLELQHMISQLSQAIDVARTSSGAHLAVSHKAITRFRLSILAAACAGRLTADWREANPDATAVDDALSELAAAAGRKKQRDSEAVDLALPDLPATYLVSTVGEASLLIEYGTSQRCDATDGDVPVLRMGNIQDGRLDTRELKYCEVDDEIERLMLQDGDLLFNRTNSPELVGKSAVFHETEPMTFASYLIRARFPDAVAQPDYVNYWINSAWGRLWARHVKTDGVSQSNINGTKLAAMPLPLPPVEEQREIVVRASRMLALADGLLARIDATSRNIERTSQAVLAKAFQGRLAS